MNQGNEVVPAAWQWVPRTTVSIYYPYPNTRMLPGTHLEYQYLLGRIKLTIRILQPVNSTSLVVSIQHGIYPVECWSPNGE